MTAPLHDRIRQARERAGLTQQALANAVGVSLRTVGNWERGESLPQNRMAKVEDVLGVKLRETSVGTGPQDAEQEQLPVGSGIDPLDLAKLAPEDAEYVRGLYERLRRERGE